MKVSLIRVYLMQALYALPIIFGWSFALLYAVKLGLTRMEISAFYLIHYSTVILVMRMFRHEKVFKLIKMSFVFMMAGFLALSLAKEALGFYLVAVLIGTTAALFWIPYNTLYFSFKKGENTALLSGFLFLVYPVMNTMIPIVSGIFADKLGFNMLFLAAMAIALIPITYAAKIGDSTEIDLEIKKTVKPAKGVRTLIYIEGFWQGITWMCLPLITFEFMSSGLQYGSFLSYLGLAGAVSVLLLCRISDKIRNRTLFILPTAVFVAAATIGAGFSYSVTSWMLINGLISFSIAMASPFTLSVIIDKVNDARNSMVARELFLNLGRITGVIIVITSILIFNDIRESLIIAGLSFIAYPIVLSLKKIYPSRLSIRSILSGGAYEIKET